MTYFTSADWTPARYAREEMSDAEIAYQAAEQDEPAPYTFVTIKTIILPVEVIPFCATCHTMIAVVRVGGDTNLCHSCYMLRWDDLSAPKAYYQAQQFPTDPRPSPYHYWDSEARCWELDDSASEHEAERQASLRWAFPASFGPFSAEDWYEDERERWLESLDHQYIASGRGDTDDDLPF